MNSKISKIAYTMTLFGICTLHIYPLRDGAVSNFALGAGAVACIGTLGAGVAYNYDDIKKVSINGALCWTGGSVAAALLVYVLTKKALYQYTPTSQLEHIVKTIKELREALKFAKDIPSMSHESILSKISTEFGQLSTLKIVMKKFNAFQESVEFAKSRLEAMKPDLDSEKLKILHDNVNKDVCALDVYIGLRLVLISVAFASTDNILFGPEFMNFTEFGSNGLPNIDQAKDQLDTLKMCMANAKNICTSTILRGGCGICEDLRNAIYKTTQSLKDRVFFLTDLANLKSNQVAACLVERSFSKKAETSICFGSIEELCNLLNSHSTTAWPLVTTKLDLNADLKELNQMLQSVYQLPNAFDCLYPKYRLQATNLIDKLQGMVEIVENNLSLIVKSKDYNYQVELFERHQEMERQRQLEEERIRRQEEMEKHRLEQERQMQRERIAHEKNMAYEKVRQEKEAAELKRQHERELLAQKVEADRAKAMMNSVVQKPVSSTTYNTYYTTLNSQTPVQSPITADYQQPCAQQQSPVYQQQYVDVAPSAPPLYETTTEQQPNTPQYVLQSQQEYCCSEPYLDTPPPSYESVMQQQACSYPVPEYYQDTPPPPYEMQESQPVQPYKPKELDLLNSADSTNEPSAPPLDDESQPPSYEEFMQQKYGTNAADYAPSAPPMD